MRQLTMLCALSLAACGDGEAARQSIERDQKILSAKEKVKTLLRDPSSAVFSGVTVSDLGAVCGRVNAKNAFGGMTGSQRFVVAVSAHLEESFDDAMFKRIWGDACVGGMKAVISQENWRDIGNDTR